MGAARPPENRSKWCKNGSRTDLVPRRPELVPTWHKLWFTSGVDHALCERVTTVLRPYLDTYTVEVSSPGFERPLRTRDHFVRAVGRPVRVKTETGRARGQVVSAGERAVQIAADGEPVDIPYEQIVRANLIDEGK